MTYAKLTAAALGILSIVCFTIQNNSRTTQLSLDLYVAAWKLADQAPVPMLMWGSFALGASLAWLYNVRKGMAMSRRVRQLEQEMALAGRTTAAAPGAAPSAPASPGTPASKPSKEGDGWA